MPYYGDGSPYYGYGGSSYANHSSLMTGGGRTYHNPIAARYAPHLSTISESPFVTLRRYSPAASTTTTTTTSLARPRRIIDTADIDVSKPPRNLAQENRQQRHRLRRDRPTIKIRSQALKDNPALREYNEKHEKSVGELLVEKFLIKEKQYQETEPKMRLYHQASLITNNISKEPSLKERENDILAAMRRGVTRRMTRRRSSAGVIPLDPEQIEREAALQAAQAVALDSLVAEEQAEIEVEVRRGTFAKRQAMRLPLEISEVSETEEDDELEEDDPKIIDLIKHPTKKKKKRKIEEAPQFTRSDIDDEDELQIPESVIEEEEFEWDDREKCDDIRMVCPAKDETEHKLVVKTENSDIKIEEKKNNIDLQVNKTINEQCDLKEDKKIEDSKIKAIGKVDEKKLDSKSKNNFEINKSRAFLNEKIDKMKKEDQKVSKDDISPVMIKDEILTIRETSNVETRNTNLKNVDVDQIMQDETVKIKDKKIYNVKDETLKNKHGRIKRTISAPQSKLDINEVGSRFKIEACNSVGDMSTLYVKAANTLSETRKTIEQYRESIRLPAPRRTVSAEASVIETEVILPVRKPYIHDTSRNSVYLALKPSQNIHKQPGANNIQSVIIDETRKESNSESVDVASIDSRPAKCDAVGGDESKTERGTIISEQTDDLISSGHAAISSAKIKKNLDKELKCTNNKLEVDIPIVNESLKLNRESYKEEFVSWWDDKSEAELTKSEIEIVTKAELGNKTQESTDKIKNKLEDALIICDTFENKTKLPSKVKFPNKIKNENDDLQNTSKLVIEAAVVDKNAKSISGEIKEKPLKEKEKVQKLIKDVKVKETKVKKKLNENTEKKLQPLTKTLSEDEREIIINLEKETPRFDSLTSSKEKSNLKPKKSSACLDKKVKSDNKSKIKCELSRIDRHHLPKIPEEQKSPSPTEKKQRFTSKTKTNDTSQTNNKSSSTKEQTDFSIALKKADESLIKSNLTPVPAVSVKKEKDVRRKKVDAEAVMRIEKKILEDAESPNKILTSAIPEPQNIETTPFMSGMKKEGDELQEQSDQKVGLLSTKKKSSEAAAAHSTEIDFWSEIKTQERVQVSGTPNKVQSDINLINVDLGIEENVEPTRKSLEKLNLDLANINTSLEYQEDQKTPLIPYQEDLTPLIADPATPLVEHLSEVPVVENALDSRTSSVICNDQFNEQDLPEREQSVNESELTGTVKKISKWTNLDNLSNLNEADGEVTPIASKEVSPQVSVASSTTKKKIVKRKKSATPGKKKSEKTESTKTSAKTKVPVKKVAASPQTSVLKAPMSATGSPRNMPNQRPDDLKKLFYTTPAILLTATPRDLRKVRRAKAKRKKPLSRTASLSSDSTGSTRSTATTSTEEGSNCEEDAEQKRLASTRSNDSGFDGSPRLSNCDMVCHKKCEKLTGNLCGLNQKLVAEALQALKKAPSQSSDNQRNADGEHFHHSGRITPPATNLPRFKKYEVTDFNFLKVLGKGSFGKVLLAELRGTECVYAVKCLKKDVVLEDDDVECTLIERKVLTLATRHPYLCHLFCTFQTESHLFFVMEYLNGGDLMFHIQKSGRFSEQRAKFYAAEIWSGLIFLHKKGIVYRDLKLDNVLLDFEGHIRIADFGMCKLQIFLDRTADTFCGTPDYMAPEIIKGLKYNQAVDWWSFGVLLYEMLTGQSPFSGCDEDELFWSICNERPFIPRYLSQSSTDILVCLLEKDSGKRIPGHEIACHPFFCTIAWDKLERRTLEAPFKPAVEHTLDTRYFDTAFTTERPRLTPVPEQILTSMDQEVFRGFSYTNPNATD